MIKNKLKFEAKAHRYTIDDKPLTGVTSVLAVIAKPALIQWAANMAVDYIAKRRSNLTDEILKEARSAHRKKKEDAGTKGKDAHTIVEELIKKAINTTEGIIGEQEQSKEPQINHFISWAKRNNVKFLASEKVVMSETLWLAGTLDFICEINGKKYVGDLKTSSGIYGREYFAQCAAYRMMAEEEGDTGFEGSVVIRCGKKGDFEEVYSLDYENDKKLFLACLDVYRTMGSFNPVGFNS